MGPSVLVGMSWDARAPWLAGQHANTPSRIVLDTLGREVICIAYNRNTDVASVVHNEKYLTFSKLVVDGKPQWIHTASLRIIPRPWFPHEHRVYAVSQSESQNAGTA